MQIHEGERWSLKVQVPGFSELFSLCSLSETSPSCQIHTFLPGNTRFILELIQPTHPSNSNQVSLCLSGLLFVLSEEPQMIQESSVSIPIEKSDSQKRKAQVNTIVDSQKVFQEDKRERRNSRVKDRRKRRRLEAREGASQPQIHSLSGIKGEGIDILSESDDPIQSEASDGVSISHLDASLGEILQVSTQTQRQMMRHFAK